MGKVIQLQGDQRQKILEILIEEGIEKETIKLVLGSSRLVLARKLTLSLRRNFLQDARFLDVIDTKRSLLGRPLFPFTKSSSLLCFRLRNHTFFFSTLPRRRSPPLALVLDYSACFCCPSQSRSHLFLTHHRRLRLPDTSSVSLDLVTSNLRLSLYSSLCIGHRREHKENCCKTFFLVLSLFCSFTTARVWEGQTETPISTSSS